MKLDVSAYYDRIKIPLLVEKLRNEYALYWAQDIDRSVDENAFWQAAEIALTFQWSDADEESKGLLKGGELPRGLPQGLMASGFFANAYLLEFDRAVGLACTRQDTIRVGDRKSKVRLHDYCRYVDDLRLVVSTDDPELDLTKLQTDVTDWIQKRLDKSLSDARGASTLTGAPP
ncbi:RNA-directed DNA polymerase [Ralstonia nicotianae]